MNKKILFALVCVLTGALLLSSMSIVSAKNDKFIEVSGEIPILFNPMAVDFTTRGKSDTEIWYYEWDALWFGGIEGSGTITGWWKITKVSTDFKVLPIELVTLTNPTIDGQAYVGELIIGGTLPAWRIIAGTGELANIHGQGRKWIDESNPLLIHYEGLVHFDP